MNQALLLNQLRQLENPDSKIVLGASGATRLLLEMAWSYKGVTSGDDPCFRRFFWEQGSLRNGWRRLQSTVDANQYYGGTECFQWFAAMQAKIVAAAEEAATDFQEGSVSQKGSGVYIRAKDTWGRFGVGVSQMRSLPVTLSLGEPFDTNLAVVLPKDPAHLPAIWCFCSSPEFHKAVRAIDQKLNVTNATLVKVPFDLDYWQKVAQERYPDGLPEPHSDDPTQWLFRGDIPSSTQPLHVAMARLLGYTWPDQLDDGLAPHTDADGIVTLTPLVGQEALANRLRALLRAAYESPAPPRPKGAPEVTEPRAWDETTLPRLLARAGCPGISLDEWLRDRFFEGHCKLFHQRPFLWHIWDGRKDGFHAFVNYHKLDRRALERLTHVYLGEWLERQKAASDAGDRTAEGRLLAAHRLQEQLEAIHVGEKPLDIYVRWKSLAEQPMGWEPDLNDGVRLNIRPFVTSGILRSKVNVHWNKDRGKDPKPNISGTVERHNDLHFKLAEKRAARGGGG